MKKAGVTGRYFHDMAASITEMCRVLRSGKKAIIIVSSSNIKGINVETHQILAEMAENTRLHNRHTGKRVGFKVDEIAERVLDDSKRQLPYIRGDNGAGMRTEYVIILDKVERARD